MRPVMARGQSGASWSLAYQFLECILASSPGNLGPSDQHPGGGAVRLCGIRAVPVGTMGRVHLRLRRLPPVNAVAGPSERAQRRIPESTPIRSLLNVKAATLRHASKSPIQTAPAGRPATPRLPGFVEVFHLAPGGRHAGGDDFALARFWGGLTGSTSLREGSFFGNFRPPSESSALRIEPPSFPSRSRRSTNSERRYHASKSPIHTAPAGTAATPETGSAPRNRTSLSCLRNTLPTATSSKRTVKTSSAILAASTAVSAVTVPGTACWDIHPTRFAPFQTSSAHSKKSDAVRLRTAASKSRSNRAKSLRLAAVPGLCPPGRDQDESSMSSLDIGFRLTSSKVSASCALVQLNNVASFASCRGPFPRARMNAASRSQPSMVPIQYVSDENPSAISVFGNHTTSSSSSWMSMPTSPIRAAVCICRSAITSEQSTRLLFFGPDIWLVSRRTAQTASRRVSSRRWATGSGVPPTRVYASARTS